MPPTTTQGEQLLDAFIAALRDEVAAPKSAKGDPITSLTDDVPVELEVGGRRYKGSVLYVKSKIVER